jgi:hypothetical protein
VAPLDLKVEVECACLQFIHQGRAEHGLSDTAFASGLESAAGRSA